MDRDQYFNEKFILKKIILFTYSFNQYFLIFIQILFLMIFSMISIGVLYYFKNFKSKFTSNFSLKKELKKILNHQQSLILFKRFLISEMKYQYIGLYLKIQIYKNQIFNKELSSPRGIISNENNQQIEESILNQKTDNIEKINEIDIVNDILKDIKTSIFSNILQIGDELYLNIKSKFEKRILEIDLFDKIELLMEQNLIESVAQFMLTVEYSLIKETN